MEQSNRGLFFIVATPVIVPEVTSARTATFYVVVNGFALGKRYIQQWLSQMNLTYFYFGLNICFHCTEC